MLRAHRGWLVLLPALALGVAGCVVEGDSEDWGEAANASVAEEPEIYGTFRSERIEDGQITLLTLMDNGQYHRTEIRDCAVRCAAVKTDGQFTRMFRGEEAMLVLKPARGAGGDAYQYVLREQDTLALRPIHEKVWMTLDRTVTKAWCAADDDCQMQGLPVGPCASDWFCGGNVCKYACTGPKDSE